jgi:hypothetical protein
MIEEGLYKFILANEALAAAMPSSNALFMDFTPEDANAPSIEFSTISSDSDTTLDGPSGLVTRRFQFTFIGKNTSNTPNSGAVQAKNLAEVFRQQCDGLTGTLPDGTRLFNMWLDQELSSYDSQANVYHMVQDYFVQFWRETPSTVFTT